MQVIIKRFFPLFLALANSCGYSYAAPVQPANGTGTTPFTSRLGINLDAPKDWSTELPFVDVFRSSRKWVNQKKGEKFGSGPELELDEHGWVKRLEPERYAETPFLNVRDDKFPSGIYTCLYEGEGKIVLKGVTKVIEEKPGRIVFELTPKDGFKTVQITATNPDNYIRNIRILMPGTEETYQKNPWNLVFLERWKNFNTYRFMDWMRTNGSQVKEWADRPKMDDANWSGGVPLEMMIDLCNRTGINPWFCMPHLASDDYVRQFAMQVKRDLKPNLKAYLEYSNEIWNTGFIQTKWAAEQGQQFGASENIPEAASKYYAFRSMQIFKIWEDVFGGYDRFLRVIATMSASPKVSETKLTFQDAYKQCDVLATAPYLGLVVPVKNDKKPDLVADKVSTWTVDQILDHVEGVVLPKSIESMQKQKAIADKYHLTLVAYEGGQHLVGLRLATNNEALNKLFYAANRHERMGQIYKRYLDAWRDLGGGTFCLFSSVGRWSKSGSWGLLEYNNDSTPKYDAVMQWNQDNPLPNPK